jgi:hypothetical protein
MFKSYSGQTTQLGQMEGTVVMGYFFAGAVIMFFGVIVGAALSTTAKKKENRQ